MSLDVETAAALGLGWHRTGTDQPEPAGGTEPNRRKYVGRHRPGPYSDRNKQRFVFPPAAPTHNPLHPADRLRLNPSRWQRDDVQLPAPVEERTGVVTRTDPTAPDQPVNREQVLGELRDAISTPEEVLADLDRWVAAGCPVDDQTDTTPADTAGEGQ